MMFKSKNRGSEWAGLGDLSTIGLTLAFAIVIGFFAGRWIGGKLGNPLVGSIIGFLFGTTAGFVQMFRAVSRWNKRIERQEQTHRTDEIDSDKDS